jgi:RNA polymerase sigma-70 factor (ECF subfamily)
MNDGDPNLNAKNNEAPDEALWDRFRCGDNQALEQIVSRYQDFAYRVAYSITGNGATAEEAVQEAFAQLLVPGTFFQNRGAGAFKAWFYGVVQRVTRHHKRSANRAAKHEGGRKYRDFVAGRVEHNAADENGGEKQEAVETRAVVRSALTGLRNELRQPLVLYFVEGLSQAEIAAMMGISQSLVARRIQHGAEMLKKKLLQAGFAPAALALPALVQSALPVAAPQTLQVVLSRMVSAPAQTMGKVAILEQSVRGAAGAGAGIGKSGITMVLIATVAVATVGGGLWLATLGSPENAAKNIPPPVQTVSGRKWFWDFNTPEWPEELKITRGGGEYLPHDGVDGSGCIATNENLFLTLDLPKLSLPVKVSWQLWPKERRWSDNHTMWEDATRGGVFYNLMPLKAADYIKDWNSFHGFFTPQYVDGGLQNMRTKFIVVPNPKDNSRILIRFFSSCRLDNLAVEEISPNELPDASELMVAYERIPPEKRVGQVFLPELKSPLLGRQVYVQFDDLNVIETVYRDEFSGPKLDSFWETVEPADQVHLNHKDFPLGLTLEVAGEEYSRKAKLKLQPNVRLLSQKIPLTKDVLEMTVLSAETTKTITHGEDLTIMPQNLISIRDDQGRPVTVVLADDFSRKLAEGLRRENPEDKDALFPVRKENRTNRGRMCWWIIGDDFIALRDDDEMMWGKTMTNLSDGIRIELGLDAGKQDLRAWWCFKLVQVRILSVLPPEIAKELERRKISQRTQP